MKPALSTKLSGSVSPILVAGSIALGAVSAAKVVGAPDRSPTESSNALSPESRVRLIIETDAGGDPDDEQSLVRFLLYVNEWDVEGIIANRPRARDGENLNRERTGLGIVRALVKAYGECWPNLEQHDARYPRPEALLARTVAGYDDSDDGPGRSASGLVRRLGQ